VEKFDLIVLVLDKQSLLFNKFDKFKHQYALDNATLVVVFLGEKANRIISGQQISDIDALPPFDDSEGRSDATLAIQGWVYEAQANMYSGNTVKLKTAIFMDACDNLVKKYNIEPANILGNLEETDYFQNNQGRFELITISKIAKLEALAKAGDEKALYDLGIIYTTGDGVDKDGPKAQMLLYKAYLRGNIDAIFALMDLFDEPTEHFRKEAAKHR
jgi:TPR repeat protein